ncbi:DUF427 domain-containing protein [Streptomyces sp. SL13]|uniref:DUF427 domain-containing protein n=1 Tax=Streptantibioticus silvisoli TaxID=2705255 RepID=A0AA90HAP7_9ACTN|nr:DUF427 domain-containing protein [Streptantibioticus silvisoli]MDI5967657.1 DUF427 domain-containing protein [Streptantibioticus silvisoli]MDI5974425.1 DUF427 domain-containing protein [Streptantibioticus silvisoli]
MAHGENTNGSTGHTVTAVPGTQRITVEIDGRTVADSRRPVLVYETGIPVRFYLPPDDVDLTLFDATDTHTTCPFKGLASYWTLRGDDTHPARPDVAWAYEDPIPVVSGIKGHLSFYDTVAQVTVEGEVPPAPAV